MLRPGTYNLTNAMCADGMLCVTYAVAIEAEVNGTVVLDANRHHRVFHITGTGVELVGLNITGGFADENGNGNVSACFPT